MYTNERYLFTKCVSIYKQRQEQKLWKNDFSSQIKQTYTFEPYLNIGNVNHRKALTKLRLSSHKLEIEVGRWNKITRDERSCRSCELGKVENETHFFFEWSRYTQKRIIMYNFIKEKLGIGMRKEHEQLNNFQFLCITGK